MSNADIALLERWLRQGDPEAFKTVALRYAGMVYSTCHRVLHNASDAEDVAQDCFEALASGRAKPATSLGPWLHRVATNRALKRLSSDRCRKAREKDFTERVFQAKREAGWDDIYEHVDNAIDHLPNRFRAPIVAHFLENQTHDAIAQSLGVSRQTVTYRIAKGVDLVRASLKRKGVGITALSLAALLNANTTEAAPAGLMAGVGKLALAGPRVPAPAPLVAAKLALAVTAVVAVVAVAALSLLGVWDFRERPGDLSPRVTESAREPKMILPNTAAPQEAMQAVSETVGPVAEAPRQTDVVVSPVKALVRGRVLTMDGSPVAGAGIFVGGVREDFLDRGKPLTRTGADGTFGLDAVPAVRSYPAEFVPGGIRVLYAVHADYAPGWNSFTPDPQTPTTVDIRLSKGGTVEGTVSVGGRPVAGAVVALALFDAYRTPTTDTNGGYRIEHVPAGEHTIGVRVREDEDNGLQREARKTVELTDGGAVITDFTFPKASTRVEGTVTAGGQVVRRGQAQLTVEIGPEEYETLSADFGNDGHYAFIAAPAGRANLFIRAFEKGISTTMNAVEIIVPEGGTMVQDMAFARTRLSGRVVLPDGPYLATVSALRGTPPLPEMTREALRRLEPHISGGSTPRDGTYQFIGLAPGQYTIMALAFDQNTDSQVDELAATLYDAHIVNIEEEQPTELDLIPAPLAH